MGIWQTILVRTLIELKHRIKIRIKIELKHLRGEKILPRSHLYNSHL